jgi:hypothetical protein
MARLFETPESNSTSPNRNSGGLLPPPPSFSSGHRSRASSTSSYSSSASGLGEGSEEESGFLGGDGLGDKVSFDWSKVEPISVVVVAETSHVDEDDERGLLQTISPEAYQNRMLSLDSSLTTDSSSSSGRPIRLKQGPPSPPLPAAEQPPVQQQAPPEGSSSLSTCTSSIFDDAAPSESRRAHPEPIPFSEERSGGTMKKIGPVNVSPGSVKSTSPELARLFGEGDDMLVKSRQGSLVLVKKSAYNRYCASLSSGLDTDVFFWVVFRPTSRARETNGRSREEIG